ncbi:Alg14-domain-containing protein [Microstroma glucosiphilum]|uniref:UDP-N-acetylglucosamine transferase subunit ALG14 n=1 Tax=Pseudomicrostroma glucosiphilum TaxID=1684307 RepID=A0A316U464_9BASI|nr:Alg14-domain-containing protein [Pseudomicrostroma glucosiphilum]PWN19598.1 Alg14-domain-containing protein [Pseudomicrostroma glucosiphilum]
MILNLLTSLVTAVSSSPLVHWLVWQVLLLAFVSLILLAAFAVRLLLLLPPVRAKLHLKLQTVPKRKAEQTCKTALFLGSGGHTTELLLLASHLDPNRYTPRIYILSHNDDFSRDKALELERSWGGSDDQRKADYSIVTLPRARDVHQPWLTTPFSVVKSLKAAYECTAPRSPSGSQGGAEEPFADLLLMNGPGTCVPLLLSMYLHQLASFRHFFGIALRPQPRPRSIYVESFARVKTLSLTGKIMQWAVDRFVRQWDGEQTGQAAQAGIDQTPSKGEMLSKNWLV